MPRKTGNNNTAVGQEALHSTGGNDNTALGQNALDSVTGNNNIALGSEAATNLTAGDNNIDIGNQGAAQESNTIQIGSPETHTATYVAGISGATVPDGLAVVVGADGHLGIITSSARYKEAIKPMDKSSEAILSLQPVTFHYKKEFDPNSIPQFGLVAEQVEEVNPDLVACDNQGKPYTVRYEAISAMLLNEFLKEHRKVEKLEATVAAQQKDFESQIACFTASLKAQAAQIQKVSEQIKSQGATRVVVSN
jgi:trimeric autotransporter adhesin